MMNEHRESYLAYLNSYNCEYELMNDGYIRLSDNCTEILVGLDNCMEVKIKKKNPIWKRELYQEMNIGNICFSQTEEGILSSRTKVNLRKVPVAETVGLVERTIAYIEEAFLLIFSDWALVA